MDREVFKEKLDVASADLDKTKLANAVLNMISSEPIDEGYGTRNLVIFMEELAELQQEISKYLRGKNNYVGLIEEIADVILGIETVKSACGITSEDIRKALNVKIERLKQRNYSL